jgi:flagellar basal body L-ring protein FlgH
MRKNPKRVRSLFIRLGAAAWMCSSLLCTVTSVEAHSVYNVSRSPFASENATSVGDLITIIVDENANAVDKGQNKSQIKDNQVDSMVTRFLQTYIAPQSRWNKAFGQTYDGTVGTPGKAFESSTFDSNAENKNSHVMTTKLQGRVIEMPSPDQMLVRASRTLHINGKAKTIYVSGIIRRQDIGTNSGGGFLIENSIRSEQMAETVVEIDGQVVSKDLQPGFLGKLLRKIF